MARAIFLCRATEIEVSQYLSKSKYQVKANLVKLAVLVAGSVYQSNGILMHSTSISENETFEPGFPSCAKIAILA